MLRDTAIAIWKAAVDAVGSERLVANWIRVEHARLHVANQSFALDDLDRILVVGAGKAGAGMATAVEAALGRELVETKLSGWVNVPADCVRSLQKIVLHPARPAGVNEPTEDGVFGAEQILHLVGSMTDRDLCLVLLSGGGSALLPAPVDGVSLADKQSLTRLLMSSGATITELNTVRKQLSRIKGGGLARACRYGTMITLVISDVIGDPLDVIASGPTVDDPSTADDALQILKRLIRNPSAVPVSVWSWLEQRAAHPAEHLRPRVDTRRVSNHLIGSNAVAVAAAQKEAERSGFHVLVQGTGLAGVASDVGRELAELCLAIQRGHGPVVMPACILSGGEPVVKLTETNRPRKGGRNQELALAACSRLNQARATDAANGSSGSSSPACSDEATRDSIVILSGGTDGEDGPTDAAGAFVDSAILKTMHERNLTPEPFLAINDSYTFFEQTGGLLKTGPTHTNVMDVRVALIVSND